MPDCRLSQPSLSRNRPSPLGIRLGCEQGVNTFDGSVPRFEQVPHHHITRARRVGIRAGSIFHVMFSTKARRWRS